MQELIKSRIVSVLAEQRPQIFLWCPVFMGFGILAYFSLMREPSLYVGGALLSLVIGALFALRNNGAWRVALLFALCAVVGFAAAQIRSMSVHTSVLMKKIGTTGLEGTIVQLENLGIDQGLRIVLEDVEIERLEPEDTPRRVRVKLRKDQDLRIGQRVSMLAGLNPPARPAYPGGFDFQRYMFFRSIGAIGFTFGGVDVVQDRQASSWEMGVESLRNTVSEKILALLKPHQAGVTAALMVGQRGAISEEDQEAMRASGLAHMLAISGLHIGLFSGVVFFFSRLLLVSIPSVALKWPVKKISAAFAIMAALFYMSLAGATIPTQRAVLMTGIVLFAIVMDRTALSMRLVAFAAMCVLLFAPESLMSASFQMSFSAVAGLVAFYEYISPWLRTQHRQAGALRRAGLYVFGVCMTTVIATFATAPFALFHFQQLAVFGVLGNILAMPVLTFVVMPLSVLAYALMPFGLEGWALPGMGWGVSVILSIAHFVSDLEHSVLKIPVLPLLSFLAFVCGFLLLVLLRGRLRLISAVSFVLAFGLLSAQIHPVMLIASDLKLIGYRDASNAFYVTSTRKDKFTREIWERRFGLEEGVAQGFTKEGAISDLRCGEGGCRVETPEYKIAVLEEEQGLREECEWADLVIVRNGYDLSCGDDEPSVIDRKNATREGPYAVYVDKPLRVRAVQDERGFRPWVAGYYRSLKKDISDKSASN